MTDLLIIGAGPAGLSAAIGAAGQGVMVTVIDEFPKAGGRLLGQLYQEPDGNWWNGMDLGAKLQKQAEELEVDIRCGVSVFDLTEAGDGWIVYSSKGVFRAKKLLLATGATETPLPIPGWTKPGVISVGAAQVMTNVHRVKPGNSCVIVGANVLSMAIAQELIQCGITIKGMYLPLKSPVTGHEGEPVRAFESLMSLSHLAPSYLLRKAGAFGKKINPGLSIRFFPAGGMKVGGIPIHLKTAAAEIVETGNALTVKTLKLTADGDAVKGSEGSVEADFVCISGGLAPMSELASVAGCKFKYIPQLGGHVPVHNERMQTNVPGLYVAGNITGVESAKVALKQGTVAGISAAAELIGTADELEGMIRQAIDDVVRTRAEALIQFKPGIDDARTELYREQRETEAVFS